MRRSNPSDFPEWIGYDARGDFHDAPSLSIPVAGALPSVGSTDITVGDRVRIPSAVRDLESFRTWAHSGSYPDRGEVAFLDGEIWVDLTMEELVTHNLVKSEFAFAIMSVLRENRIGEFIGDRMLLTNANAGLSTEPDGMVLSQKSLKAGRIKTVPGKEGGIMEFQGSPDLALEIVSQSSRRKDWVTLRQLYFRAGVAEYWLVDVRGETPVFELLTRGKAEYRTASKGDWQSSRLLGRQFRIVIEAEQPPLHARFAVEWRPLP